MTTEPLYSQRIDKKKLIFELIKEEYLEDIQNKVSDCHQYIEYALKADYWFEDTHFNLCKIYMYDYLLKGRNEKETFEKAILAGETALLINRESFGAKFSLRNLYESANNLIKANSINEQLVANEMGDSLAVKKLYESRMF